MGLKEYFAEFHRGREGQYYEPEPFGRLGQGRWVEDKPNPGLVAHKEKLKPNPSGINLLRHKPRQRSKPPKPISEAAVDHLSQEMIGALENNNTKKLEGIRSALAAYQEKDQNRILDRTVRNWPGNKEWRGKSKSRRAPLFPSDNRDFDENNLQEDTKKILKIYYSALLRGAVPPIIAPMSVYEKIFKNGGGI